MYLRARERRELLYPRHAGVFCTFIADKPAFAQFMKQAKYTGLEVG